MVSPQKERGHVGIANELWDAIICRDFTKRQKDILQFILRLSYGCNRKNAFVPKLKDFSLCGLGPTHVKDELIRLEERMVIKWNRSHNEFEINKNYEQWNIGIVKSWDSERFKKLVHINLKTSRNGKSDGSFSTDEAAEKVTETGSYESPNWEVFEGQIVTQSVLKVTETGSLELPKQELLEGANLLKQEVRKETMEDGKLPNQEVKLTETVSKNENKLLKQEVRITETVSSMPNEPNQGAASGASKKGLKKEKIKDIIKDNVVNDIVAYLNEKANKRFSTKTLNTVKHINRRLSEGRTLDDFRYVIDVKVAEWLNNPKMNQYLRPETLFTPTNFESYINQPMPLVDLNESSGFMTPNQRHYERNKIEAQKIMEAMERERVGDKTNLLEN